jgi:hypothetical protein
VKVGGVYLYHLVLTVLATRSIVYLAILLYLTFSENFGFRENFREIFGVRENFCENFRFRKHFCENFRENGNFRENFRETKFCEN